MRILLATSILLSIVIVAQRNAAEEAICQKFLTSKSSSPLIPTTAVGANHTARGGGGGVGGVLKRNLRYDEECEFSCELVLQDRHLPIQIRATIHEGLGHLALRHIELGR
jgi:hypothetical protein